MFELADYFELAHSVGSKDMSKDTSTEINAR
jgi:hypothetical protein